VRKFFFLRCEDGQDKDYYNQTSCKNWAYREVCRLREELQEDQQMPDPKTVSRLGVIVLITITKAFSSNSKKSGISLANHCCDLSFALVSGILRTTVF
jgi:hypothetical protein